MRPIVLSVTLLLAAVYSHRLYAHGSGEQAETAQETRQPSDEAEKPNGPALQGRVTDEAGQPLRRAKIVLYGGFATRWKIAGAETDADGRYRFDTVRSTMLKGRSQEHWDYNVGVRLEHPTHVEADGRSWRDVRFPALPGHIETLDLILVPAGRLEAVLKDAETGEPLKNLDLRIMTATDPQGSRSTFSAYAETDDRGNFRSIGLFPGVYDVQVNSSTLDYPAVGRAKVEGGETTQATFDAVSLPKVIGGRVLNAKDEPINGVELTLLAPQDSDVVLRGEDDFMKVRSRAWTIWRPEWQGRFELAFLPGLEKSRFVLAFHKEQGWAKIPVKSLERDEPVRLIPW